MNPPPIVHESEASDDVAAIYADIKQGFQIPFVPNFFKSQAGSPHVLSATWNAVKSILIEGEHVPRTVKEMIFVAVSQARGCHYCQDAHLAFCKLLGVDRETTDLLVGSIDELRPKRTRDVIRFATKVATDPRGLANEDYDLMVAHGVSRAELTEVMVMACLALFATTLADAVKIDVDDEFLGILSGGSFPRS